MRYPSLISPNRADGPSGLRLRVARDSCLWTQGGSSSSPIILLIMVKVTLSRIPVSNNGGSYAWG